MASFTAAGSFCSVDIVIEQLVDPDRQGEGRAIKTVIFEPSTVRIARAPVVLILDSSSSSASTSSLQSFAV